MSAHVQTIKSVNSSGVTPYTTANSITLSQGSLLICVVCFTMPSVGAKAITSAVATGSLTMTKRIEDLAGAAGDYGGTIFSLPNMAAGTYTVTITHGGTPNKQVVFLMEVSSAATSSEADGTGASATGPTTALNSGTMAGVTKTDDFWVAVGLSASAANPGTITAGTNWTIPANGTETNGTTNLLSSIEYRVDPGTTSGNGTFTYPTAEWTALAFAFKNASSSVLILRKPGSSRPFPFKPGGPAYR